MPVDLSGNLYKERDVDLSGNISSKREVSSIDLPGQYQDSNLYEMVNDPEMEKNFVFKENVADNVSRLAKKTAIGIEKNVTAGTVRLADTIGGISAGLMRKTIDLFGDQKNPWPKDSANYTARDKLNKLAKEIKENPKSVPQVGGNISKNIYNYLKENRDIWQEEWKKVADGTHTAEDVVTDFVSQFISSAPDIADFMTGPVGKYLSGQEKALQAGKTESEALTEGIKEGSIRWAMGRFLKMLHPLAQKGIVGTAGQAVLGGAGFGGETAVRARLEGGEASWSDIGESAAMGTAMSTKYMKKGERDAWKAKKEYDEFAKKYKEGLDSFDFVTNPIKNETGSIPMVKDFIDLFHGGAPGIREFEEKYMRTGTGGMSQGAGFYMSASKKAAEQYKTWWDQKRGVSLSDQKEIFWNELRDINERLPIPFSNWSKLFVHDYNTDPVRLLNSVDLGHKTIGQVQEYLKKQINPELRKYPNIIKRIEDSIDKLENKDKKTGNIYKASVPFNQLDLLDWDKTPTRQQINKIKKQIDKEFTGEEKGEILKRLDETLQESKDYEDAYGPYIGHHLYKDLTKILSTSKKYFTDWEREESYPEPIPETEVSSFLYRSGIHGNVYESGRNNRNFVFFSPKTVGGLNEIGSTTMFSDFHNYLWRKGLGAWRGKTNPPDWFTRRNDKVLKDINSRPKTSGLIGMTVDKFDHKPGDSLQIQVKSEDGQTTQPFTADVVDINNDMYALNINGTSSVVSANDILIFGKVGEHKRTPLSREPIPSPDFVRKSPDTLFLALEAPDSRVHEPNLVTIPLLTKNAEGEVIAIGDQGLQPGYAPNENLWKIKQRIENAKRLISGYKPIYDERTLTKDKYDVGDKRLKAGQTFDFWGNGLTQGDRLWINDTTGRKTFVEVVAESEPKIWKDKDTKEKVVTKQVLKDNIEEELENDMVDPYRLGQKIRKVTKDEKDLPYADKKFSAGKVQYTVKKVEEPGPIGPFNNVHIYAGIGQGEGKKDLRKFAHQTYSWLVNELYELQNYADNVRNERQLPTPKQIVVRKSGDQDFVPGQGYGKKNQVVGHPTGKTMYSPEGRELFETEFGWLDRDGRGYYEPQTEVKTLLLSTSLPKNHVAKEWVGKRGKEGKEFSREYDALRYGYQSGVMQAHELVKDINVGDIVNIQGPGEGYEKPQPALRARVVRRDQNIEGKLGLEKNDKGYLNVKNREYANEIAKILGLNPITISPTKEGKQFKPFQKHAMEGMFEQSKYNRNRVYSAAQDILVLKILDPVTDRFKRGRDVETETKIDKEQAKKDAQDFYNQEPFSAKDADLWNDINILKQSIQSGDKQSFFNISKTLGRKYGMSTARDMIRSAQEDVKQDPTYQSLNDYLFKKGFDSRTTITGEHKERGPEQRELKELEERSRMLWFDLPTKGKKGTTLDDIFEYSGPNFMTGTITQTYPIPGKKGQFVETIISGEDMPIYRKIHYESKRKAYLDGTLDKNSEQFLLDSFDYPDLMREIGESTKWGKALQEALRNRSSRTQRKMENTDWVERYAGKEYKEPGYDGMTDSRGYFPKKIGRAHV
jgi:hypothetical protein